MSNTDQTIHQKEMNYNNDEINNNSNFTKDLYKH